MTAVSFKEAKREHNSVLAAAEKRALIWMAHQLPQWVNSDHLTFLGLAAMFFAGLSYWFASVRVLGPWLVIVCLVVNWFGDSLDGTLARVRNRQRPRYGFYVDHIVDAFCMLFLFTGLALSGYMSWLAAAGLLVAYFMLCLEVYLATYAVGVFHISFAGFGPTELRIVLAVGNMAAISHKYIIVWGHSLLLFDVGAVVAMVGMFLLMVQSAVKHSVQLYEEERLPCIPPRKTGTKACCYAG